MRALSALSLLLCTAFPAAAAGGLRCDVDDDAVTIAVASGVTHGMGSPLFDFKATIEIKDTSLEDDMRRTSYGHATQYWLDGEALNLLVYWEREGSDEFASVETGVTTRFDDAEGLYEGDYAITVYGGGASNADGEPLRYRGRISCDAE